MKPFLRRRNTPPKSIVLPPMWQSRRVWALAVLVAAVFLVYSGAIPQLSAPKPSTRADHRRYHDQTFRVVKVVDGDTLDIDVPDGNRSYTRIRLWGVDTPEVAHDYRGGMYFGAQASAYAHDVLDGRSVHVVLSPRRTRGKYGRLLAYVYLEQGGEMFNEQLLQHGFAYADLRFPHHYDRQFEAIEQRARRSRVGLWAKVSKDQMPSWRQRSMGR